MPYSCMLSCYAVLFVAELLNFLQSLVLLGGLLLTYCETHALLCVFSCYAVLFCDRATVNFAVTVDTCTTPGMLSGYAVLFGSHSQSVTYLQSL